LLWKLDDLPAFVAVVERNGISAAAEALNMPKSTVSATISRLETALGVRLLERTTRNVRTTDEGRAFYLQARQILEQAQAADTAMAGLRARPAGPLSVALPPAFCNEVVAPHLPSFSAEFPDIELNILVTSHDVDLMRDQVDIAVVVGPLEDSELISRTLVASPLIWVASPDYLRDHPAKDLLAGLTSHVRFCERRYALPRLAVHIDSKPAQLDLSHGPTRVNDPLVVRRAVAHGGGVSLLPRYYCQDYLDDGRLVEVLPNVTLDHSVSRLTLVYSNRRLLPPRAKSFMDFLIGICAQFR
jgi:LysR family transcriptional regulator for bpeEF and oprC